MNVVSNTSPLRYLIAIGRTDLIENIFGHVVIPSAVELELSHASTPAAARSWITQRPTRIEVQSLVSPPQQKLLQNLDSGEAEAIQLALDTQADFLLLDERLGRQMATDLGITVVGVLGILIEAYRRQIIDQPEELMSQLQNVGFRISRRLVVEFGVHVAALRDSRR